MIINNSEFFEMVMHMRTRRVVFSFPGLSETFLLEPTLNVSEDIKLPCDKWECPLGCTVENMANSERRIISYYSF